MVLLVRRTVAVLVLAAGLVAFAGCFGISQNPSYFPHLLPTGDIIRTHARPPVSLISAILIRMPVGSKSGPGPRRTRSRPSTF